MDCSGRCRSPKRRKKTSIWGDRRPARWALPANAAALDDSPGSSSPATDRSMEKSKTTSFLAAAAGRCVPLLARACAFAGVIVCSGLAAPGTARAAGPAGIDVSAEIEAALTEVDAAVSQAPTREVQSVTTNVAGMTTASIPVSSAVEGAEAEIAAATQPAAAAASAPISTTSVDPGSARTAPPKASAARERDARKVSGRSKRRHSVVVSAVTQSTTRSTLMSSAQSTTEVVVASHATLVTGEARSRRPPRARAQHNAPAGAVPQRLPPAPLPPRPDMTSSGQGGGQGSMQPLLLAALGAVLGLFTLSLLPRVLPRPAFRKPRRIVLPPWHPG